MAYRFSDFETMYKKELGKDYPDWKKRLQRSHRKVEKVVRKIMRDHPFYAALASEMHIRFHPFAQTAATDGESIVFAPDFYEGLSAKERLFITIHEIDHNANLHTIRYHEQRLHPRIFNMAADYAINSNLQDLNGMQVPHDGLYDPKYKGWAAEQIYKIIYKEAEQNQVNQSGESQVCTKNGAGKSSTQKVNLKEGYEEYEDKAKEDGESPDSEGAPDDLTQSKRGIGTDPGELKRIKIKMQKLIEVAGLATEQAYAEQGKETPFKRQRGIRGEARLDFSTRIKNAYLTYAAKEDYTFRRPNKRYLTYGHYLPTMYSKKSSQVVLAIDNSGSIDKNQLAKMSSAVTSLMTDMAIEELNILHCDTRVNLTEKITQQDLPYEITSQAGGGTAFDPVFEAIEENGWEPDMVIYFTDLEGGCTYGNNEDSPYYKPPPPYPVIWIYARGRSQVMVETTDAPCSRDEFITLLKMGARQQRTQGLYVRAGIQKYLPEIGTFLSLDDDEDSV